MRIIFRRTYDRVILDQLSICMSERNSIIRLVLLAYNQMSAMVFHGLIRYT